MKKRDPLRRFKSRGLECVCGNLRMAARVATQIYDAALRPSGLRATQLPVLWALLAREHVTLGQLAQTISLDDTTLTRNLAVLKRAGLVLVSAGPDRRQKLVTLSVKGKRVLAQALPLWEEAQKQVLERIGPRTSRSLASRLREFTRAAR